MPSLVYYNLIECECVLLMECVMFLSVILKDIFRMIRFVVRFSLFYIEFCFYISGPRNLRRCHSCWFVFIYEIERMLGNEYT